MITYQAAPENMYHQWLPLSGDRVGAVSPMLWIRCGVAILEEAVDDYPA